MKTLNQFCIRGTIVNQRQNLHNTVLVVATSGNIHRNGNRVQEGRRSSDYPNITFYNFVEAKDYHIGDHVTIQGYAMNSTFTARNGRTVHTVELVGTDIQRSQRILAKYIPNIDLYDGGQPEDLNSAIIVGTVNNINTTQNGNTYISIGTDLSGYNRTIYCTAACFGRQAQYVRDSVQNGDVVAVAGTIHTWNHETIDERTDETRSYKRQNVTCLDIAKVERN